MPTILGGFWRLEKHGKSYKQKAKKGGMGVPLNLLLLLRPPVLAWHTHNHKGHHALNAVRRHIPREPQKSMNALALSDTVFLDLKTENRQRRHDLQLFCIGLCKKILYLPSVLFLVDYMPIGGNASVKTMTISIADLKNRLADYNPREDLKKGDPDYDRLYNSIREFGLVEPLVYNAKTKRLIGGHQRLKILEELGYTSVDVSVVNLDETREKALNVALNNIHGRWNVKKLEEVLAEIDRPDFDATITGHSREYIDRVKESLLAASEKVVEALSEFKRPDADRQSVLRETGIDTSAANTETLKDRNWFYIEYYGDGETYKQLYEKLDRMGAMRTQHEIDNRFFKKIVDQL